VQAYPAAIDLDPKQVTAYNTLAWLVAERKERLDEALSWSKKAVELAPKVVEFQDTLGWVHRARGEHDKAALVLETVAALKPERAVIFYNLGVVYAEKGKTKKGGLAKARVWPFPRKTSD